MQRKNEVNFPFFAFPVDAQDIDKRRPHEVATGESKRFLKRLRKKRRHERNRFRRVLAYLFRGICTHPDSNQSIVFTPEELRAQQRKSCPEISLLKVPLQKQQQQIKVFSILLIFLLIFTFLGF